MKNSWILFNITKHFCGSILLISSPLISKWNKQTKHFFYIFSTDSNFSRCFTRYAVSMQDSGSDYAQQILFLKTESIVLVFSILVFCNISAFQNKGKYSKNQFIYDFLGKRPSKRLRATWENMHMNVWTDHTDYCPFLDINNKVSLWVSTVWGVWPMFCQWHHISTKLDCWKYFYFAFKASNVLTDVLFLKAVIYNMLKNECLEWIMQDITIKILYCSKHSGHHEDNMSMWWKPTSTWNGTHQVTVQSVLGKHTNIQKW